MGADQHGEWIASALSVLDWWRDAGVDVVVDDAPRDWLTRAPAPSEAAVITAPVAVPVALPDTLDAFIAWRLGPDAPEGAVPGGRVAEGPAQARLMIVTDCPGDDGLIDGAPGRLLDAMLAAIGLSRDAVYVTALTTARPLGGRIAPEAMPRLVDLVRHHVALVRPPQLLLLGQAPSRAFVETNAAGPDRSLHVINLNGATVSAVSTLHPRFLIERPAMKGEAWKSLQFLSGDPR